jgi:hypothetical protein
MDHETKREIIVLTFSILAASPIVGVIDLVVVSGIIAL